jgi:hypothetical protein
MQQRVSIDAAIVDSLMVAGKIVEVRNGWSAGSKLIPSGIIRYLDTIKYKGKRYKSAINHVYRVIKFESGLEIICESHFKGGVQINSYTRLLKAVKSGKVIRIYERRVDMTDDYMAELWNRYLVFEGKGYDKKLIILYYIWNRTGRWFDKLLSRNRKSKFTCNELFTTVGKDLDPLCDNTTLKDTPEQLIAKELETPSILRLAEFDYEYKLTKGFMWRQVDEVVGET